MKWNSVRVRLTLWNVAVLALVLAGFGIAQGVYVQQELAASIDRDLQQRARADAFRFGRFAPSTTRAPDARTRRLWNVPERGTPSTAPASYAERAGFFRRPRILNMLGKRMVGFSPDGPWDPRTFHLSLAGEEHFSVVQVDHDRIRVVSVPMRRGSEVRGVVQLAHPLRELQRLHDGQLRTLLVLIPVALLIAGAVGVHLTEYALRPVRQVTLAAAQLGAEDLSGRLEVRGKDEFAELAATFNGMVARLEESFRGQAEAYRRVESAYEQQQRFTADASHELRTPIARIKAYTSLMLAKERKPEEYRKALSVADQAADVMGRIVEDLLLLARSDTGQLHMERSRVPVEALFDRAAALLPDHEGAALRIEPPTGGLAVSGDPDHLARLLLNLLENALRHTPAEGTVTLSAEGAGASVLLHVEDTGEGIPPEHLAHVCERFYRADPSRVRGRGGTGLGLAICQSIAQAHGGDLQVESEVGRGTRVTVRLPRAPAAAGDLEPSPQECMASLSRA